MPTWFSSLLSLACEQPSRQHKLNVMIVHASSNNGKYAKPCLLTNHWKTKINWFYSGLPLTPLLINCFKNSLAWWS